MTTPTISVLASVGVHVALLMSLATVVWQSGLLTTPHPSATVLAFESPGDAMIESPRGRMGAGGVMEGEGYVPAAPGGSGVTLEQVVGVGPSEFSSAAPIEGLSSESVSALVSPMTSALGPTSGGVAELSAELGSGGVADVGGSGAARAGLDGTLDGKSSVTFAGLGASGVRSVVYVVDVSGSMVTSLPMVIRELERSVSRLSSSQKFGVVLVRRTNDSAKATEVFTPVLMRATPSSRQALHDWLSRVQPAGRSAPLAGLEAALAFKPDAVFLLSRAIQRSGGAVWEQGLNATMARLEQLNPPMKLGDGSVQRPVLIQTIQFLEEDPTGILKAIGEKHGGGVGYRVVRRSQDLGESRARPSGAPGRERATP